MIEYVIKRNGRKEPFSSEKFNKLTKWSSDITSDGEADVDWSALALDAVKRLYNGCTTDEILQALINACLDKDKEAYFYIAGKLLMSSIYKNLYDDVIPPSLEDHLEDMEDKGIYLNFLDYYTEEEIVYLDSILNHSKDFTLTHSQVNQMKNKYLCTNKTTKELYETPQFMFMRVALAVCMYDDEEIRLNNVKEVYTYLSDFHLNLPTPMWTNLGTPFKTGTSCLLYTVKDSVDSLTAGDHISNIMTVTGAGIGNTIFTRSKKDPIQNGRLEHLGKIPYFRLLQANIQATMQSGARRGAATTYINCLDPEIRTLIHLRNPTSIDEERVDDIDYAFTFNSVFAKKAKKNEDWMLISYQVAPDLWESMYQKDDQLFEELFDKYLNDSSVQKTIIKARDLALEFLTEQRETGRLYEYNSSNSNYHTPFKEPIYGSNLCVAGNQLVPSNYGLLTAQELNELNTSLILVDGEKQVKSSPMKLRESYQDVYKITLKNGMSHTVTDYHKIMTDKGLVQCKDLVPGVHKAKINVSEGIFGTKSMVDEAWLLGLWQGDGTSHKDLIFIDVWEDKTECLKEEILEAYERVRTKYTGGYYTLRNGKSDKEIQKEYSKPQFNLCTKIGNKNKWRLQSSILSKYLNFEKNVIPRWVREGNKETQLAYIKGLFQTDGTYSYSANAHHLSVTQTNKEFLEQLQILLNNLGYVFSLTKFKEGGERILPDSNRQPKLYNCKTSYRLVSGSFHTCLKFEEDTGFISFRGKSLPEPVKTVYKPKEYIKVVSVEYVGKEDVYCPTVESDEHLFVSHCFITRNCNEVYLSTKPFNSVLELYKTEYEEGDGYVQTCNLCAINLNKNYTDEEYYKLAYWALRIIDHVIDHSEYKLPQIGVTAKKFRSAGVSFMNLAAYMAKNKLLYNSSEGLQHLHGLAERHEYMLMKASLELSKEYGLAEWIHKTKYPEGWLPIDTYNRNVDNIVEPVYKYDWESLRKDIIANGGIHNCVLSTSVPGESSSLVSNSTNSLYPIRQAIVIKTGANSKNVFMAPEYETYKDYYQLAWDLTDTDMTNIYSIIQKFTSQGISCDYYLDHSNPESKSAKKMLKDWLYRDHMGLKGKYYTNNKTSSGKVEEVEVGCSGGCTL